MIVNKMTDAFKYSVFSSYLKNTIQHGWKNDYYISTNWNIPLISYHNLEGLGE